MVRASSVHDLSVAMSNDIPAVPVFYFDFVDPVSYLLDAELTAAAAELGVHLVRTGVEINPPPHPMGTSDDDLWGPRWAEAERIAGGLDKSLHRPSLVPWSRKAHELMAHVREDHEALVSALSNALMAAFFRDGRDIGRVDVLVDVARELGLDRTETKAVLDVDRYDELVAAGRTEVVEAGLRVVPTITLAGRRLEGFHNRASLSTLLSDVLSSP